MTRYKIVSKVSDKCNLEINQTYKTFDEILEFLRAFRVGIDLLANTSSYEIKSYTNMSKKTWRLKVGLPVDDGRYYDFVITKER